MHVGVETRALLPNADRACVGRYRGNAEIAEDAESAEKARIRRFARGAIDDLMTSTAGVADVCPGVGLCT